MTENLSFQRKLGYKQRCDLCGVATNIVYQITHDGHLLTFCSNEHVRTGLSNWEEKKAKNIRPGVPYKEEESNILEDNTGEL